MSVGGLSVDAQIYVHAVGRDIITVDGTGVATIGRSPACEATHPVLGYVVDRHEVLLARLQMELTLVELEVHLIVGGIVIETSVGLSAVVQLGGVGEESLIEGHRHHAIFIAGLVSLVGIIA